MVSHPLAGARRHRGERHHHDLRDDRDRRSGIDGDRAPPVLVTGDGAHVSLYVCLLYACLSLPLPPSLSLSVCSMYKHAQRDAIADPSQECHASAIATIKRGAFIKLMTAATPLEFLSPTLTQRRQDAHPSRRMWNNFTLPLPPYHTRRCTPHVWLRAWTPTSCLGSPARIGS